MDSRARKDNSKILKSESTGRAVPGSAEPISIYYTLSQESRSGVFSVEIRFSILPIIAITYCKIIQNFSRTKLPYTSYLIRVVYWYHTPSLVLTQH